MTFTDKSPYFICCLIFYWYSETQNSLSLLDHVPSCNWITCTGLCLCRLTFRVFLIFCPQGRASVDTHVPQRCPWAPGLRSMRVRGPVRTCCGPAVARCSRRRHGVPHCYTSPSTLGVAGTQTVLSSIFSGLICIVLVTRGVDRHLQFY